MSSEPELRQFTMVELAEYDGRDGAPTYIAYDGTVYDVSRSRLWRNGSHQKVHEAGIDLSGCLKRAPHPAELLERFKVVGELVDGERLDECR